MPTRLRVLAGGSKETLVPVQVNDDAHPLEVKSERFEGRVTVRIKNYPGSSSDKPDDNPPASGTDAAPHSSRYFEEDYGRNATWSIQFQGRFLEPISADDLVWGNEFDWPVRVRGRFGAVEEAV